MALRRLWLGLIAALLVSSWGGGTVRAEGPRVMVRLERADIEPYLMELARVRAFVNVLTFEGRQLDNLKPEDLVLTAGGTKLKNVPGIGRFEWSGELLDVIFVVEVHSSYTPVIEDLGSALGKVIGKLDKDTTRAALVTYGEVLRSTSLADPNVAARRAAKLSPDDVPAPPLLVKALQKAVRMHATSKPLVAGAPVRKLIVVISDGNNEDAQDDATKDLFRGVSKKAIEAGVTIHSIAYSFTDTRIPLVNLGEISKKTGGTFRWARSRADVVGHLDPLVREIRRQMVLTFYLPPDAVDGKPLGITCKGASCGSEPVPSRDLKPAPMKCGGAACASGHACVAGQCVAVTMAGGRGGGIWLAFVGVLVVAGGAGFVVVKKKREAAATKKKGRAAAPGASMPGLHPGAVAPGMGGGLVGQPPPTAGYGGAGVVLPDFSKIPYLANSPQLAQLQQQLANVPYVAQHLQAQAAAQHPQPAAAAPPVRGASLMVLSGPRSGQTLPLRHGFTVGRMPGCDLVIDDGMTSGHHAQFHFDTAGGVSIVDLGSTNGTFVNGVRQTQARLANGMSLRIGQTEIRFLQG